MSEFPGKIAILGSGSWATALAKILMTGDRPLLWHIRRPDRIEEFKKTHRNPVYLSDVVFDVDRIDFSSDINYICENADTILLATPSPYLKDNLSKITVDISDKYIINAVKGIVPDENMIVTDYVHKRFGIDLKKCLVIGGPCHAEEVAMERLSYLTIGCEDFSLAKTFCQYMSSKKLRTIPSSDVVGIEYAAVLKNIYAIASGMIHGLKSGDNFLAMLVCNAVKEMDRFVNTLSPSTTRNICDSVYLGDLLVTCYSQFSRNHNFGSMIGKGYTVKAAKMEMEMVAEGYFATKCIHEINERYKVKMPILEWVYEVLYNRQRPDKIFMRMANALS